MNEFVDPQHRGVNLPEGFKDLMDVLASKGSDAQQKLRPVMERFATNALIEAERFVDFFLQSKAERSFLSFMLTDPRLMFSLVRDANGLRGVFGFYEGDL